MVQRDDLGFRLVWQVVEAAERCYSLRVKEPVINLEETPGKTVGRRVLEDPVAYGMNLQKAGGKLQRAFEIQFIPKGVYRFHSHEEADEWLITMMARAAAKKNRT